MLGPAGCSDRRTVWDSPEQEALCPVLRVQRLLPSQTPIWDAEIATSVASSAEFGARERAHGLHTANQEELSNQKKYLRVGVNADTFRA